MKFKTFTFVITVLVWNGDAWIGLNRRTSVDWEWSDGSAIRLLNWDKGE